MICPLGSDTMKQKKEHFGSAWLRYSVDGLVIL